MNERDDYHNELTALRGLLQQKELEISILKEAIRALQTALDRLSNTHHTSPTHNVEPTPDSAQQS